MEKMTGDRDRKIKIEGEKEESYSFIKKSFHTAIKRKNGK